MGSSVIDNPFSREDTIDSRACVFCSAKSTAAVNPPQVGRHRLQTCRWTTPIFLDYGCPPRISLELSVGILADRLSRLKGKHRHGSQILAPGLGHLTRRLPWPRTKERTKPHVLRGDNARSLCSGGLPAERAAREVKAEMWRGVYGPI